jgi:predicted NUDIX family phosphoesterase
MTSSELVLGLPRARILGDGGWTGVRGGDVSASLALIAAEAQFRTRADAEDDTAWKQVIPYLLLRDRGRLFLMQRSRAGGDARIHDRWTLGIGGHINPGDGDVMGGLHREWAEEMEADWLPEPQLVGLLNDDTTHIGQVHLGIVFAAEAHGRPVSVRETHKLRGEFVEPVAVLDIYDDLETWSQLLYDHVTGRTAGLTQRA